MSHDTPTNRNRAEQRAARRLAREDGIPYQKALQRLRSGTLASVGTPDGDLPPRAMIVKRWRTDDGAGTENIASFIEYADEHVQDWHAALATVPELLTDGATSNRAPEEGIEEDYELVDREALIAELIALSTRPDFVTDVQAALGTIQSGPFAAPGYADERVSEHHLDSILSVGAAEESVDRTDVPSEMQILRDELRELEGEGEFRDIPVGYVDSLDDADVRARLEELRETDEDGDDEDDDDERDPLAE